MHGAQRPQQAGERLSHLFTGSARVSRSPPSKEPGLETAWLGEALLSPGNAEPSVADPEVRREPVAAGGTRAV